MAGLVLRTGADYFGVTPDIINVAKQVTNGAIPLGGVVTSEHIYQTFMHDAGPDYAVELPHGYTFSAHPVACAAGIAALKVLEDKCLIDRVKSLSTYFEDAVHSLKGRHVVIDIRNLGFAAGLTIAHQDQQPMLRTFDIAMDMWERGFYVPLCKRHYSNWAAFHHNQRTNRQAY